MPQVTHGMSIGTANTLSWVPGKERPGDSPNNNPKDPPAG